MLREGPVPRFVHGLIEYVLGAFLVAAPFLLGYDDVSVALGISIALGVVVLVLAAITEGPTGLVKQLPVTAHFTIDFLLAIFLIAAPFILGFGDEATPRNLFIALGVVHLLISIGTRFRDPVDAGRSSASPSAARPAPTSPTTRTTPPNGGSRPVADPRSAGQPGGAGPTGSRPVGGPTAPGGPASLG